VILNDDFVSTIADQALIGTAAADVFVLGGGTDTVLGKSGQDLFLFQSTALGNGATNFAFLLDFSRADGEQLNLTNIDANAIGGLGVKPGERVATLAWNGYRHLELYFGVSGSGSVLHTLNPRLIAEQIAWIINHAEDRIIFVDLTFVPILEAILASCPSVEHVVIMTDKTHMPAFQIKGVPTMKAPR
jgi:hypothetical protein